MMLCLWVCAACDDPAAPGDGAAPDKADQIAGFIGATYATCHAETAFTIWGTTTNYSHTDELTILEPWGDWLGSSDLVFRIELGPWPVYLGVRVQGSAWSTNLTEASSAYTRRYVGSGLLTPLVVSGEFRVETMPGTTEETSVYDVSFSASK